jgi:ribonuclease E
VAESASTTGGGAPAETEPSTAEPAASAESSADDGEPEAKPRRRRTRRSAAEATDQPAPEAHEAAAAPASGETPQAVEGEAPATGTRRTRKRTAGRAEARSVSSGEEQPEAEVRTEQDAAPGGRGAPPLLTFQAPALLFQPPSLVESAAAPTPSRSDADEESAQDQPELAEDERDEDGEPGERPARRRRRGGRRRTRRGEGQLESGEESGQREAAEEPAEAEQDAAAEEENEASSSSRRRRRRRRRSAGEGVEPSPDDPPNTVVKVREPRKAREGGDEVQSVKGSTRLEAKKQRRREGRELGRRRVPIITEAEFLARRESVERVMVVRQVGGRTQIGVLEDGVLVEHFVNRETNNSYVGNVYLGKVQNVLPSMEAAFVDVGKGRNAVLYAGEVNFDAAGLEGHPRRIEAVLKSGQSVLVQVTKDPLGHKGARLTSQVSLPGRYLVYVPEGSMTGISRKLPDTERSRLKAILKKVVPDDAGVIVRTAAEGASEEELARDVTRLAAQWAEIKRKAQTANAPALLHGEPDLTVRVVRDVFNEDFSKLVISGEDAWQTIEGYVSQVAPDLTARLSKWTSEQDVFSAYRIDEQLMKALDRKVWLPSGGSLIIDRTEAMLVIDVNTGKFTGQGGNLEETVTRNNLEAAEEIVRQLRLRDLGGIIVIDFIDMVLESNRELVLRRLLECLGRDRTKHQVAEVTSLGLVQMTRKRVGQGLLEAFSETCEHCNGRGVIVRMDAIEGRTSTQPSGQGATGKSRRRGKGGTPAAEAPQPPAPAEVDGAAEQAEGVAEPRDVTQPLPPEPPVTEVMLDSEQNVPQPVASPEGAVGEGENAPRSRRRGKSAEAKATKKVVTSVSRTAAKRTKKSGQREPAAEHGKEATDEQAAS